MQRPQPTQPRKLQGDGDNSPKPAGYNPLLSSLYEGQGRHNPFLFESEVIEYLSLITN